MLAVAVADPEMGEDLVTLLDHVAVTGHEGLGLDLGHRHLSVEGDLGRGADVTLDRHGVEAGTFGAVVGSRVVAAGGESGQQELG